VPDDRTTLDAGDRTLLIVEDDPTFARVVMSFARTRGFRTIVAHTGEEAIELGIEGGGGGVEAVGRDGIEEGEEDLGVFVSGSVDRGGTAKGAPGALDPGGEGGGFGLAPAEFKGAAENFRGAREALLAVG